MTSATSAVDWAPIRAALETTTDTVYVIGKRTGVFHLTIDQRARRHGWLRMTEPDPAVLAPVSVVELPIDVPSLIPAQQILAPPVLVPPIPALPTAKPKPRRSTRQGMIDRLYRVIDNNLSQLEDIMRNQSDPSIADNEKETRTIGTVIGNIEKLKGLEDDAGKTRISNKSSSPTDTAADTERLGRELAERLSRLAHDLRA